MDEQPRPDIDTSDLQVLHAVREQLAELSRNDVDTVLLYLREWNKKRPARDT